MKNFKGFNGVYCLSLFATAIALQACYGVFGVQLHTECDSEVRGGVCYTNKANTNYCNNTVYDDWDCTKMICQPKKNPQGANTGYECSGGTGYWKKEFDGYKNGCNTPESGASQCATFNAFCSKNIACSSGANSCTQNLLDDGSYEWRCTTLSSQLAQPIVDHVAGGSGCQ